MHPIIDTSGKSPFKNENDVLAFLQESTIKGRKYKQLMKQIDKGETLKVSDLGKKYKFEAGTVTLEVKKTGSKKVKLSHWIHNVREGLSPNYKKKYADTLKDIATKLFKQLPKDLISSSESDASTTSSTTTEPTTTPVTTINPPIAQAAQNLALKTHLLNISHSPGTKTFEGKTYQVWLRQGNPNILSVQLQSDYTNQTHNNKISMGIKPDGTVVSVRVNNQVQAEPIIPKDKVRFLEALSISMSPESIQSLGKVNSTHLVDLGENIQNRQDFMNNNYEAPPAILSFSEKILPTPIIARLTHEKKNSALGVKYENGDKITNMEGALHTFLNPIGRIELTGDKTWMGLQHGGVFGKNFGNNKGRQVVLSGLVQPDFENAEVLMKVAEITTKSIQGKALDPTYQFPNQDEDWSGDNGEARREKYDNDLQRHMIHHMTTDHSLPKISEVKTMTWNEGVEFLETLIDPAMTQEQIVDSLKNKAVNRNGRFISLEVMFHVYLQQVQNEMRVLESGLPQGYVYTMDPPNIFLDAIGSPEDVGRVFNRLQTLAFMCVNKETPLTNMKVFAFSAFADQDNIQQLRNALPGKAVVRKGSLFKGQKSDYTYLGREDMPNFLKNLCKDAALVIHNNSDAFGQNIETEGNSSLDGVIGSSSSAYKIVERQRTDYTLIGESGAYTPLVSKAHLPKATLQLTSGQHKLLRNHLIEKHSGFSNKFEFTGADHKTYCAWYTPGVKAINIQDKAEFGVKNQQGQRLGTQKMKLGVIIDDQGELSSIRVNNQKANSLTKPHANLMKTLFEATMTAVEPVSAPQIQFSDADLTTFRAALIRATHKGVIIDVQGQPYQVWYNPTYKSINIQHTTDYGQGKPTNKLGVNIDDNGKITSVWVDSNNSGSVEVPEKWIHSMQAGFNKALSEATSSYKIGHDYQGKDIIEISMVRRGLTEVPAYHLEQIAKIIQKRAQAHADTRLGIKFLNDDLTSTEAIDAGGLSRDYADDLMSGLIGSKDLSFEKPENATLVIPRAKNAPEGSPFPFLESNEKALLKNLGQMTMYCWHSKPTTSHFSPTVQLGNHFHPALFAGALALTAKEVNTPFENLQEAAKLKVAETMLLEIKKGIREVDQGALQNQYLDPLQVVMGKAPLTEDHVNLFSDYLDKDADELIDGGIMNNLEMQKEFKNALRDYILKGSKVGPMLSAVHAVAQGMKSTARQGHPNPADDNYWNNVISSIKTEDFSLKVQGSLDRNTIIDSFDLKATPNLEIKKKIGWIQDWLKNEATDQEIGFFLKYATGSSSLPQGGKIKVTAHIQNPEDPHKPFPEAHSCSLELRISPVNCTYTESLGKVYSDDTKENYIKALKEVPFKLAGFYNTI